ncbi:MAG: hypothetical protein NTU57_00760 [Candidatus Aenigmarchaeota archaeon]|nr:hypothetical protein [Candidatus Aenigmarchaeota archaeon]
MSLSNYPVVLNGSGIDAYFKSYNVGTIADYIGQARRVKEAQLQQTKKLVGLPENPNFKPLIPPLSEEASDIVGKGALLALSAIVAYGAWCGLKGAYSGITGKMKKMQHERLMNTDSMKRIRRESDIENNLEILEKGTNSGGPKYYKNR